jgi:hypothetical protein
MDAGKSASVHGLQQQFPESMLSRFGGGLLQYIPILKKVRISKRGVDRFRSSSRLLGERQDQPCRREGEKCSNPSSVSYISRSTHTHFRKGHPTYRDGWRPAFCLLACS